MSCHNRIAMLKAEFLNAGEKCDVAEIADITQHHAKERDILTQKEASYAAKIEAMPKIVDELRGACSKLEIEVFIPQTPPMMVSTGVQTVALCMEPLTTRQKNIAQDLTSSSNQTQSEENTLLNEETKELTLRIDQQLEQKLSTLHPQPKMVSTGVQTVALCMEPFTTRRKNMAQYSICIKKLEQELEDRKASYFAQNDSPSSKQTLLEKNTLLEEETKELDLKIDKLLTTGVQRVHFYEEPGTISVQTDTMIVPAKKMSVEVQTDANSDTEISDAVWRRKETACEKKQAVLEIRLTDLEKTLKSTTDELQDEKRKRWSLEEKLGQVTKDLQMISSEVHNMSKKIQTRTNSLQTEVQADADSKMEEVPQMTEAAWKQKEQAFKGGKADLEEELVDLINDKMIAEEKLEKMQEKMNRYEEERQEWMQSKKSMLDENEEQKRKEKALEVEKTQLQEKVIEQGKEIEILSNDKMIAKENIEMMQKKMNRYEEERQEWMQLKKSMLDENEEQKRKEKALEVEKTQLQEKVIEQGKEIEILSNDKMKAKKHIKEIELTYEEERQKLKESFLDQIERLKQRETFLEEERFELEKKVSEQSNEMYFVSKDKTVAEKTIENMQTTIDMYEEERQECDALVHEIEKRKIKEYSLEQQRTTLQRDLKRQKEDNMTAKEDIEDLQQSMRDQIEKTKRTEIAFDLKKTELLQKLIIAEKKMEKMHQKLNSFEEERHSKIKNLRRMFLSALFS